MPTLHPFHPIIYVRGFAATASEIEEAVADPYMGFNQGSTKSRTLWTGTVQRFYFESPAVRLATDFGYEDTILNGEDLVVADKPEAPVPYRCVVIHRYYEDASDAFSDGQGRPIEHFARELGKLILRLRDRVCENPANKVTPASFRVYLVAHSMGGLVCRAMLQNSELASDSARRSVDKLFTYATPHNGIDLRIVNNVPGWATFGDVNNFNRKRMAGYLALPEGTKEVAEVVNFPADRVFTLVGTNPRDYSAMRGLSSWAAGDDSDGLVRIENATTFGVADGQRVQSPNAFVHRSHSGHYGIVNSEEGYQNLVRFFFGGMRVDGYLDVDDITLPVEVTRLLKEGRNVKASYQFEVVATVRGCRWQMHRRCAHENSAIFRSYDQLFPEKQGERRADRSQSPHLFSAFLHTDSRHSVKRSGSVSLGFELAVLVPDYKVDGRLFLQRHFEGGYIFKELILVEAFPDAEASGGWRIKYGFQSVNPGRPGVAADTELLDNGGISFSIPIEQRSNPGMHGKLRIVARNWNQAAR